MSTILFAVDDDALRGPYARRLEQAGHCVVPVERALAVLGLAALLRWDAAVVDGSALGREALDALSLHGSKEPIVGLGLEDQRLAVAVPLPLHAPALVAALESVLGAPEPAVPEERLRLDSARRLASSDGREVALTRTEFRLLQLLKQRHPGDVPLVEVLAAVWGFTEGRGTSELVRAHVRNLRRKLQQIGLPDAVRSRRGRGYALAL